MDPVKEENLNVYSRVISSDCTEKIIEQNNKIVCKIMMGNKPGSGFICKILSPDKK